MQRALRFLKVLHGFVPPGQRHPTLSKRCFATEAEPVQTARYYLHEQSLLQYIAQPQRDYLVMLVGPVGSGKRTLLKTISNALRAGRVDVHAPELIMPLHQQRVFNSVKAAAARAAAGVDEDLGEDVEESNDPDSDQSQGLAEFSALSPEEQESVRIADKAFVRPASEDEVSRQTRQWSMKRTTEQPRRPAAIMWDFDSSGAIESSPSPTTAFSLFLESLEQNTVNDLLAFKPDSSVITSSLLQSINMGISSQERLKNQDFIDSFVRGLEQTNGPVVDTMKKSVDFLRKLETIGDDTQGRSGTIVLRFLFQLMQNISRDDRFLFYPCLFIANLHVLLRTPEWGQKALDYHDWIMLQMNVNQPLSSFPLIMSSNHQQHSLFSHEEFDHQGRTEFIVVYPLSQQELKELDFTKDMNEIDFLDGHNLLGGNLDGWSRFLRKYTTEKDSKQTSDTLFKDSLMAYIKTDSWKDFLERMEFAYSLYSAYPATQEKLPTCPQPLPLRFTASKLSEIVAKSSSELSVESAVKNFQFLDLLEKTKKFGYAIDYGVSPAVEVVEHRAFQAMVDANVFFIDPYMTVSMVQKPIYAEFLDLFIELKKNEMNPLISSWYFGYRTFWGLPSLYLLQVEGKLPL